MREWRQKDCETAKKVGDRAFQDTLSGLRLPEIDGTQSSTLGLFDDPAAKSTPAKSAIEKRRFGLVLESTDIVAIRVLGVD